MTRPPTAAQRRVIDAADPVTGRLRGTEAQLEALVKRGWPSGIRGFRTITF